MVADDRNAPPSKGPALVALGEALVDLVPLTPGASVQAAEGFAKAAGGAPANVASGVARLGGNARLLTRVGGDALGEFLLSELRRAGVDVSHVKLDDEAQTVLALVSLDPASKHAFEFYGAPAAHWLLSPGDVTQASLDGASVLHFGSISLIQEPSRSATLHALKLAEGRGMLVSFDPNLRAVLWPSLAVARETIVPVARRAGLLKLSREELRLLAEGEDPADLAGPNTKLIVVTDGRHGAELWLPGSPGPTRLRVRPFEVAAVDATGAGDAFVAALLYACLAAPDLLDDASDAGRERLSAAASRAAAFAALTTTKRGGVAAMPSLAELERFLQAAR